MQISARNQLKVKITNIKNGPISTEVELDINGQTMVSIITTGAANSLDLKVGDNVTALVKATSVMIMK